jgi:hypothetical protein
MAARHIRVTVSYVEILDNKDLDEHGEFVFEFKAMVPGRGIEQSTRVPETGHLAISDHPSMNKVSLNTKIFEGQVEEGDTLVLEAAARELDRMSKDDELTHYRRELSGPLSDWAGSYTPWDEGSADQADPEQLGDWRLAYEVELD